MGYRYGAGTRAAVYTRVSTARQVSGSSLKLQREGGLAHVADRSYVLVRDDVANRDVFEDVYTGTAIARPAFTRLLQCVREDRVDLIVVAYFDRWSRMNQQDVARVDMLLDAHNCRMHSLDWENELRFAYRLMDFFTAYAEKQHARAVTEVAS